MLRIYSNILCAPFQPEVQETLQVIGSHSSSLTRSTLQCATYEALIASFQLGQADNMTGSGSFILFNIILLF